MMSTPRELMARHLKSSLLEVARRPVAAVEVEMTGSFSAVARFQRQIRTGSLWPAPSGMVIIVFSTEPLLGAAKIIFAVQCSCYHKPSEQTEINATTEARISGDVEPSAFILKSRTCTCKVTNKVVLCRLSRFPNVTIIKSFLIGNRRVWSLIS